MAIQGFFTGDVKIRELNGVLRAVDGIVDVTPADTYVPYTGATGNVDLGYNTLSAGFLKIIGNSAGAAGHLGLRQDLSITYAGINYTSLTAEDKSYLAMYFAQTGSDYKLARFNVSGLTNNTQRTYSFPDASGTLALASDIPIVTGYVPYTGATQNVDLGEYGISSGYFQADLTPSGALQVGRMQWNSADGTMDLRLMGNNVTLQIGQEQVARVVNGTGGNLLESNYQAVKIIGAQGQRLQVGLARADNDANSKDTLGLVTENINNNQEGFITVSGLVNKIDTTGSLQGETWSDGDTLYLSGTTAGAITNVKPTAPIHTVIVGFVVYAHANNGKIYVKVDNGYELEELHDVAPTPYVNKGVLYRDTATNLWKSATIGTLLGYTPANAATTLTINGTAYDISANRTWSVGTVTSIATTGPLTGGTITGSGTIGITQASTSTDGYLSSTDWNTFNSKQAALTFSAPLINTSGTISIPAATSSVNGYLSSADWDTFNNKQAALSGTGFVKISGTTISYDNSTYYLASNPSSFITLTALSATAPLSYSNTTGVFSISQATTSTDGYLSSTDWNTFNNKQAAGNYITALTGEATASGPGSASVTLSTSAVTGKLLTGLNLAGGGTIAATDSILQAFGKVQNQISGLAGGVTYQGTWNASTNTPTLTSSVGTKGYYYIVDVAGSTNLNGITDWKIGDWAIFNGSTWDKVDNTDAVSSVNGFTGAVSLTTSNIAEGTNLYYLDSRARLALSFTAGSGAYDNTTGVITIPTNTSQLTNGANFITLSSLSASSPLAYNSGTGAFSIQVATGSQNGYLSSTDWTTFNSKQPAGNYVTTDTTQTITALKTFTAKVVINTGGTDDQLQLVGTAPSVRLTNAATGATINGFIAMSGGANNYIQGSVSGDMTIGNQNNGKILFGFGSGTATQKMSLDSSGNAVLSGGLTLGSTLSNGTYTYTLPGATGTLALVGGAGVGTVTSIATTGPITGGTITSTGTIGITQSGAASDGYLSSTDWNTFNNKQNALTNPVTGTGTTNYLPKFTGTSTIGNSLFYDNGTSVVIGTATPATNYILTLRTQSADYTKVLDWGTAAGGSWGNMTINISAPYQTILNSGAWQFNISGTQKMLLDNSGNLGLGVTPSAWDTSTNVRVLQMNAGSLWGFSTTAFLMVQNSFSNTSGVRTYVNNGFASEYEQASGQHIWKTAPSGTAGNAISFTQAMTLNASGNLSIGNTNDTYKLDVTGTARFSSFVESSTNFISVALTDSISVGTSTAENAKYNYLGHSGYWGLKTTATGFNFALDTYNGGTPKNVLTITQAGAATFSSSVTAGGTIVAGTSATEGTIHFGTGVYKGIMNYSAGTGTWTLNNQSSGSGPTLYYQFQADGSSIMSMLKNGNVGIGTTSPSSPLDVYGNIRSTSVSNTSIYTRLEYDGVYAYGTNLYLSSNSGYSTIMYAGGSERMRITSGGDVCINATSTIASAKLYVNGIGAFGNIYVGALGTGTVYSNAGTLTNTNPSDFRLKNTIKPLTYGLNEVLQLNPKTFYYNDDVTKARLKYGFIAQEVKDVMPDLVRRLDSETDYLGLENEGIFVTLVNAIKEQQAQINELKSQLNKQE